MIRPDYYEVARNNEEVFRNVLRDLALHGAKRPMGRYIPKDLDPALPLDLLFERYSKGERRGKFTILNFSKPNEVTARLSFEDVAFLSGGGAELEYLVRSDSSVEFKERLSVWMS